ncbi:PEP-CTERM sorting domain-containing protein [Ideonella sp. BN130291]|uniref:PEP-CTERM sorting domain-containing protein n=1 Tax=Ideonella sp. BN130291 TaxID=3112940 RepID=UPI002E25FBEE|nr:PEP-CTERM sorting domain-containing protein [Ideonella sp. BN130291]
MTRPALRRLLQAALLTAASCTAAHATTVALAADGGWSAFNVNDLDATSFGVEWIDNANSLSPDFGSPLSFSFTVAAGMQARLTVVDAGFAGDTFAVFDHGSSLGATSSVALTDAATAVNTGTDFDAALANTQFSRAVYTLGAGEHLISGSLLQSVQLGGQPLNATVGGVRLEVSAVPEPATWLSLLAGMGLLGFTVSRRCRP